MIDGADGAYLVGLVGANGTVVDSIPGVAVWGDSEYSPGDRVVLVYTGQRPIPFIASGGGSGGSGGESVPVVVSSLGFNA